MNDPHAIAVIEAKPSYGRPVLPADVDDVENAWRLYHERLTELLANMAADGVLEARYGVGMLPHPLTTSEMLASLRDLVEETAR